YKTGLLSVNEEKLTAAVRSNGNKVRNVLGNLSNGIASRIYNKTSFAINNAKELYPAAQLETNHINNTYFYNPNNSSILQSNVAYSTGLLLNYLV
ncbi:MAG: flagellar filament capping protein FliD, partial [Clostridium sp.]